MLKFFSDGEKNPLLNVVIGLAVFSAVLVFIVVAVVVLICKTRIIDRKVIKKTGAKVDFEHFTNTCEARVVGSEESVSRALTLITEIAQCCGFVPSM